jgi:uncharacterized protein (TIGR00369 family)
MEHTSSPLSHVVAEPGGTGPESVDAWRQPVGVRERRVAWADPAEALDRAMHMSGRATIDAVAEATLPPPPIATLLGFAMTETDDGRVVFSMHPGEHLHNPIGMVHGGALATLLDSAMGCAVQTTLDAGQAYSTLDLQVRFVRPVVAGGPLLRCEGVVVHRGRRVATGEGRVTDDTGKLYAHGSTSCLILDAGGDATRG